jgi:hypothetical protein
MWVRLILLLFLAQFSNGITCSPDLPLPFTLQDAALVQKRYYIIMRLQEPIQAFNKLHEQKKNSNNFPSNIA